MEMLCPDCNGLCDRVPEEDGGGYACRECDAAFWTEDEWAAEGYRPVQTLRPL